ncbi:hypothetical protein KUTeg_020134 [Tegillarca granosa]|uniref:Histidine kinase/HSP90-like ATPase domain-containing protein n=1 Tax=Tegillarca granosa TaxID=220873 RepID=A0ABQ9E763_TEGGR|nr:hypothetical protein KUTeg_020134 [Tegillarca granosa]
MRWKFWYLGLLGLILMTALCAADEGASSDDATVDDDIGKSRDGSRTDDEAVQREEEAIKLDGLNVAQMKELREKAEKHTFQAEVDRMMKLIINSLYKNKEIFLRELISNASDALDKIRFLSLTDKEALSATEELSTIAKSGTSEFLTKLGEATSTVEMTDLIGQFGVGFYSSFLVADRVIVTSKHNDDEQHIWESDSASFSVSKDPRGNTLQRGTTISLHLKEEAHDFLEENTLKDLIRKYSQFINFNIYLWTSKTEEVEEPIEEEENKEADAEDKTEDKEKSEDDEDAKVEEEKEDKPKTKKVSKTIWDWELMNNEEYNDFYKTISKESDEPLARVHFVAEGEVTFKSILYIAKTSPNDMFTNYGKKVQGIKMYVRRVFITDDFEEMMPKYLNFVRGVVIRKTLDMIKKLDKDDYEKFWKEYSTNIKLGVIEDNSNRTRLAKLLRFQSSNSDTETTSLAEYVERMKEKQEHIFFVAGSSRKEVENSPFVERLLRKGYEVLYLVEPVDEYCIQSLPEFDGKKFQNVAKEGLKIDESEKAKEKKEALEKEFEPLTKWLKDTALNDKIEKAVVSERLTKSPCALVASQYGWSGNMERIMKAQAYAKAKDVTQEFYATQKKTLEVNPRHPLIKELKTRVETDGDDQTAKDLAVVMFETATLRSGYSVPDSAGFAERVERMLRLSMDIPLDAKIDDDDLDDAPEEAAEEEVKADDDDAEKADDEQDKTSADKDEL